MTVKPYTIIEVLKSKGFSSSEAEDFVEFITESSTENILNAIKPLATREEVKDLIHDAKESITRDITRDIGNKIDESESKTEDKIKLYTSATELRIIKWLIGISVTIIGVTIAALKYFSN